PRQGPVRRALQEGADRRRRVRDPARLERQGRSRLNATLALPEGAPSLPPPQTITTYCLPLMVYVDGVALPAAGSVVSHSSLPDVLSNARNLRSKLVAPMDRTPPAVTSGPP